MTGRQGISGAGGGAPPQVRGWRQGIAVVRDSPRSGTNAADRIEPPHFARRLGSDRPVRLFADVAMMPRRNASKEAPRDAAASDQQPEFPEVR